MQELLRTKAVRVLKAAREKRYKREHERGLHLAALVYLNVP
jgi:hypothetical protein